MELINATGLQAGYTVGVDLSAREHVVVAIKGTFAFPEGYGEVCPLAPEQLPLVMADEYWGEPGRSSPRREMDFALRKPACDVLLNATAHSRGGEPVERVRIGVKLGGWSKVIDVVGDRVWRRRGTTLGPSAPRPFVTLPLTYERAFGGVDDTDPERPDTYMPNPIGCGHGLARSGERLDGRPLPNTEEPGRPVTVPWGAYRPMGLGVRARNWHPRYRYAGTYDQRWLDEVYPFLPADFDDRYHQAAPEDQQLSEVEKCADVVLANLTPSGRVGFRLPAVEVPVTLLPKRAADVRVRARLDTVLIEPNEARVALTWRASLMLKRGVHEVAEVLVGDFSRGELRARRTAKLHLRSLADLDRPRAPARP